MVLWEQSLQDCPQERGVRGRRLPGVEEQEEPWDWEPSEASGDGAMPVVEDEPGLWAAGRV